MDAEAQAENSSSAVVAAPVVNEAEVRVSVGAQTTVRVLARVVSTSSKGSLLTLAAIFA